MKQILIALLLAFTTSTVINAQKQSSIEKDSTENVKVTLSKKTDTKADESNTTVTVIGVDTTAGKDANSVSSSGSSHGKVGFTFESDDNDLPFGNLSDTISGGILISIIAIVAVFGLPVFILFVIFFFRYKNRKPVTALPNRPLQPDNRCRKTLSAKTGRPTNAHKASKTPLQGSDFSSSSGRSPESSESEQSDCLSCLWASANG